MKTSRTRRLRRAALFAVSTLSVAATILTVGIGGAVASPASGGANPIVRIDDGLVRGTTAGTADEFPGIPYAAPPTGNLRWRPPAPPASWEGVRDATQFGPSCPQPTANNPYLPPGPISENCLYLNVYTPTLRDRSGGGRPVLVWIHGGGLVQDGARNYDGSKLAADGTVVVTINYRLGALGFLAHPALASRPGGLGELRRDRQPVVARTALAAVRRRGAGDVARTAAATGRDGLRRRSPLLVLGRRMTHPPSPTLHPDSIPSS
jgi:para-nitrobenzyl esterase